MLKFNFWALVTQGADIGFRMSEFQQYVPEHRRTGYKNRGQFRIDELRRRREEAQVEIRRQKREENLSKRRTNQGVAAEEEARPTLITANEDEFLSMFPRYVEDIQSDDPVRWKEATIAIRRALSSEGNPPVQIVVDSGVVPRIIGFMRSDDVDLVFEAAWSLTNIASGNTSQTAVLIEHGALPCFVELLRSSCEQIQEQAAWAIGNITGDCPRFRDEALEAGALDAMIPLLSSTRIGLVKTIAWTISNFCRGRDPYPSWETVQTVLPVLSKLLYHQDPDVVGDSCWSVSFLSDGSNQRIQAVIDSGIPRRLVELLGTKIEQIQSPALRCLGNIVTGDDIQTQTIINAGVLPMLGTLLNSRSEALRKETCWALSNITAGTSAQIQAVIDANLVPSLIHIMSTAEFKTRKEACWAIANATSGALQQPDQIKYFVEQGCIKPLCDLLTITEATTLNIALDGIENILKVGEIEKDQYHKEHNEYAIFVEEAGGVDKISELQQSPNERVYQQAYRIISQYFSDEGEEDIDASVEPVQQGQYFGFGMN